MRKNQLPQKKNKRPAGSHDVSSERRILHLRMCLPVAFNGSVYVWAAFVPYGNAGDLSDLHCAP